ncbi:MsnO8 family LLM class oxidoreductase [Rhodococcus rhodnii]|uniref:Monooxygenase n=2 Tax=Rhodococcus rhodnii TaxID=38312 RepID=R7WPY6_9NOCA|nr:MsnO8 family LLM class oxidoreductase [Rhodococcus rhodnii]EOM77315.1 monooxygenase [Rhodococcus rhodnii LMG 5362]TXG91698.1 MsnO8 family LLM class oxidoreductase [Rhodococcus rhodnii]
MRVSVVDLGVVTPGESEADALAASLEFALAVEQFGYRRIWFAEHHLSRMGAAHHPELLIAAAAARTSRIRVGSGAVLMNHYSPFKVAEMFQQLESMFPGRIDLGMGRATGGPVVDIAMQRDRTARQAVDHSQQVLEALAWLGGRFPADHPFAGNPLVAGEHTTPQPWLLGSSPSSAELAAALGIGYTFAGFIAPAAATSALRRYREAFRPTEFGPQEPRAMLAVNVTVGEDDRDGARLAGSPKGYYARLRTQGGHSLVPLPEEAERELTEQERAEPTTIADGRWPRFVAGSPATVRATIEQMADESGADEVMVQSMIPRLSDRIESHRRLAEALIG